MEDQLNYVKHLSSDIYNSLVKYTDQYGFTLNRQLREHTITAESQKMIDDIDLAFLGVPVLQKSLTVYRSLDLYTNFTYRSESYLSTGLALTTLGVGQPTDKSVTCCVLEITIPSGCKVLPLTEISVHPHEQELLLPRDGSLLFISETIKTVENIQYNWIYCTFVTPTTPIDTYYIGERFKKELKIISNIFTEERIQEIMDESHDFNESFEEFMTSLRIEINSASKLMSLNGGIADTYIDSLDQSYYRDLYYRIAL
jgi:hypothetical protein